VTAKHYLASKPVYRDEVARLTFMNKD